jgi:hypothetical protein
MKNYFTVLFTIFCVSISMAQIDFTPYPGNITHCPAQLVKYTSTVQGSCGVRTWTVTKGIILDPSTNAEVTTITGNSVDVRWNDETSIGTLKVTVKCGTETFVEEKSYVIRSVKEETPQNFRLFVGPISLCSTNQVALSVDHMYVPNTGGASSVTLREVDGYEWEIPSGWSGSSSTNQLFLTPSNGCVDGSVRVRGYIDCGSRRYSNWSQSLNPRVIQPFAITAPGSADSYALQCGSTSDVTFTATSISCASNYTWTFPAGWRSGGVASPVITTANTITLTPLATPANESLVQGSLTVTANLGSCNRQSSLTLGYNDPLLSNPVFTSGNTQLICNSSSTSMTINPVNEAGSYTWYTYGPNLKVNGIVATSASPTTTTSTSITLSLNRSIGENDLLYVKASRSNGCAGSPYVFRNLWLGKPMPIDAIAQGLDANGPFYLCQNQTYQFNAFDYGNFSPVTNYTWSVSPVHTIMSYNGSGNVSANIKLGGTGLIDNTSVSVYASNACGVSPTKTVTIYQGQVGCVGGPIGFSVFPNPTTEYIEIEYTGEESASREYEIQLSDDTGAEKMKVKTKEKKSRLSTQELKKGIYLVKIKSDNYEQDFHILKE